MWFPATACPQPPPASCNPNSDQIALYADSDYRGQCIVKFIGNYSDSGAVGISEDSASSIRVGGGVKATLCEHPGFAGVCETFTGDDPNLGDNGIGDNRVSSAKVEVRNQPAPQPQPQPQPPGASCSPNADQVALFLHTDYNGQCVVKGIGNYANPGSIEMPNDLTRHSVWGVTSRLSCANTTTPKGSATLLATMIRTWVTMALAMTSHHHCEWNRVANNLHRSRHLRPPATQMQIR